MPKCVIVKDPKKLTAQDRDAFEKLSPKMQLFVMEVAQDFNVVRAAKEVGYKNPMQGHNLMKREDIRRALRHIVKPVMEENRLNQEALMQQLSNFIFFDPTEVIDSKGRLKCELSKLPEPLRQCIQGIKITPHYDRDGNLLKRSTEIQFVSKTAAMSMALKALSMIVEQHHHTFSIDTLYKESPEPITVEGRLLKMLEDSGGKDAKLADTK